MTLESERERCCLLVAASYAVAVLLVAASYAVAVLLVAASYAVAALLVAASYADSVYLLHKCRLSRRGRGVSGSCRVGLSVSCTIVGCGRRDGVTRVTSVSCRDGCVTRTAG